MMKLKNIALTLSLLFSVNSLYAYENSCYLAGGTYNDGVCHFGGDLHSVSFDFPNNIDSTNDYEFRGPNNNNTPLFVPVADKESDQVTVSGMFSTNMLFSGGDYDRSTVFDYISTNGGSAIFNFIPELRILGGNGYDSPAIRYAAYGQGSQAYLDSSEYFELSGGTGEESSAIYSLAANGGEAVIIASGDSKNPSQFNGGSNTNSSGIEIVAQGTGSFATIEVQGASIFMGGAVDSAPAIKYVSKEGGNTYIKLYGEDGDHYFRGSIADAVYIGADGSGSVVTIDNNGIFTFIGSNDSYSNNQGYAIYMGAAHGGKFTLNNYKTIKFNGGSSKEAVYTFADNSTAELINTESSQISFIGNEKSAVYSLSSGEGVTSINNEKDAVIEIIGGSFSQPTLRYGSSGINAKTEIFNNGNILVKGGNGNRAYGIDNAASLATSQFIVENYSDANFTIQAGSGNNSSGINFLTDGGAKFEFNNDKNGTLNIIGNEKGIYAINYLTGGVNSTVNINNNGTINLNSFGIKQFDLLDKSNSNISINNLNGSVVNAEVEAIFELTQGTSGEDAAISVVNPVNGRNNETLVDGFGSSALASLWALKEDWAQYSSWGSGAVLNITDVVNGSLASQQIEAAFQQVFGKDVQLNFLGEENWASEEIKVQSDVFTADIVNKLIDQGYAGNIVTNFNLNNATSDGAAQALTIGTGTGEIIKDSIGFRKVEGVSSVTVNSGKYFALIGQPAGGELIEGGAPVTLDNGTLMLGVSGVGTARADSSTAGTLETVTMKNGSHVNTDNMWVQAESIKGAGTVSLTDTGRMHVKNLTISGDIRNQGTLSADTLTISKGSAASSKTLKSSGKITVESTASLSADGILAADSFDIKGVVKLGKNAAVYTGAAALEQMRKDHADAAAELDRVEGKAGVSTLSVLDRIVAESMKTSDEAEGTEQGKDGEASAASASDDDNKAVVFSGGTSQPRMQPSAAQAFAAFDAVNRIAGEIESGAAPDRHGLWVKLEAIDGRFGVVEGGSSFDVDTEGAVVGAESAVADGVKLGAALSYLDGEIDASGLKNNWTSWGLHLYGAYRADAFALKGTAGWLRGTTEAEKDLDADVWHAGLRVEYGVPTGAMTITPFMGARVMSGSFDDLDSQTVFSIPMGAKLSGTIEAAGWTLTPMLEAAYVHSIGDTEAEDIRFLPKDAVRGSVGLKAEKGMWTGELAYAGATGSNDYRSNSLHVKIGLRF